MTKVDNHAENSSHTKLHFLFLIIITVMTLNALTLFSFIKKIIKKIGSVTR